MACLGNPILSNDSIGLVIGRRLAGEAEFKRPELCFREFTGSPLKLVMLLSEYRKVVLIDSVVSGRVEVGTVMVFREEELGQPKNGFHPHGINIPEAIYISRKYGISFPDIFVLAGIEVGEIGGFGEELTPALAGRLEDVYRDVAGVVREVVWGGSDVEK